MDHHADDVHALSGAYVLDALDPDERAHFEAHLRRCPACQEEVAGFREVTVDLAAETASAPPPALREGILSAIKHERQLPPLTPVVTTPDPAPRSWRSLWRRPAGLTLVAAVTVLVLAVTVSLWQSWIDDADNDSPSVAEQVLAADDAIRVSHDLPGGAQATVVVSRSLGKGIVETHDMPSASSGHVYQLWLQNPEGLMEPAGLMPDEPAVTLPLDGDLSKATAVGITVEPDGGSPEPTTDPVAVIELPA